MHPSFGTLIGIGQKNFLNFFFLQILVLQKNFFILRSSFFIKLEQNMTEGIYNSAAYYFKAFYLYIMLTIRSKTKHGSDIHFLQQEHGHGLPGAYRECSGQYSHQWVLLGLPAVIGCAKNVAFAGILGRAQAWLEGWKERMLSQAGKEILIKAVVQRIVCRCSYFPKHYARN